MHAAAQIPRGKSQYSGCHSGKSVCKSERVKRLVYIVKRHCVRRILLCILYTASPRCPLFLYSEATLIQSTVHFLYPEALVNSVAISLACFYKILILSELCLSCFFHVCFELMFNSKSLREGTKLCRGHES